MSLSAQSERDSVYFLSTLRPEGVENSADNDFERVKMTDLPACVNDFLSANDFSRHTAKAIRADVRKFAHWFSTANGECFDPTRVTVRDVADFREHLARVRRQSVATVIGHWSRFVASWAIWSLLVPSQATLLSPSRSYGGCRLFRRDSRRRRFAKFCGK